MKVNIPFVRFAQIIMIISIDAPIVILSINTNKESKSKTEKKRLSEHKLSQFPMTNQNAVYISAAVSPNHCSRQHNFQSSTLLVIQLGLAVLKVPRDRQRHLAAKHLELAFKMKNIGFIMCFLCRLCKLGCRLWLWSPSCCSVMFIWFIHPHSTKWKLSTNDEKFHTERKGPPFIISRIWCVDVECRPNFI